MNEDPVEALIVELRSADVSDKVIVARARERGRRLSEKTVYNLRHERHEPTMRTVRIIRDILAEIRAEQARSGSVEAA